MRKCHKYGKENPADVKYCLDCQADLDNPTIIGPVPPPPPPKTRPVPEPKAPDPQPSLGSLSPPEEEDEEEEEGEEKKERSWWPPWKIFKKKKEEDEEDGEEVVVTWTWWPSFKDNIVNNIRKGKKAITLVRVIVFLVVALIVASLVGLAWLVASFWPESQLEAQPSPPAISQPAEPQQQPAPHPPVAPPQAEMPESRELNPHWARNQSHRTPVEGVLWDPVSRLLKWRDPGDYYPVVSVVSLERGQPHTRFYLGDRLGEWRQARLPEGVEEYHVNFVNLFSRNTWYWASIPGTVNLIVSDICG